MSRTTTQERLALKTPEAAFLQVLKEEFRFSPRVSRELLNTAKEMLLGSMPLTALRPGQVRLVVTSTARQKSLPRSYSERLAGISPPKRFG